VNWSRPGAFARDRLLLESLDALSANYIHAKAEATGQTPAQVIGALARGRGSESGATCKRNISRY
jgi:hypothetical protein